MIREYELTKDNYGLKAGERFLYLSCIDLYLRKIVVDEIEAGAYGGHEGKWKFTPEQMVTRYFKPITDEKK